MGRKQISLFATHIPKKAPKAVADVIASGWINRGKKAEEFEAMFRKMFGYRYVLSTNSCTSALRMAYDIVSESPYCKRYKDEVITTPYTMVATNTTILECGLKPVFVDVKYETANIDTKKIVEAITDKTIAIAAVDYAGYPCKWMEINKIANKYNLFTIQDAAHAIGAKYFGNNIGFQSDITCFSFGEIKHITTGNGGMFVTTKPSIHEVAKKKIWYGIDKEKRIETELGVYPLDIDTLGYKYGMNDIAATMGIYGLRDLNKILKQRKYIADRYYEELSKVSWITLMERKKGFESANWLFPMHVEKRSPFAIKMRKAGIEVAVHNWSNNHYSIFGWRKFLRNAERLSGDLIHIPLHSKLSEDDIEYIIKTVRNCNC